MDIFCIPCHHKLHANASARHYQPRSTVRNSSSTLSVGFTLIELLVVLAIVALLLSIAAPKYFNHIERAKENTLRQSLAVMRDALDKFEADRGAEPAALEELVSHGYLRQLPEDPFTGTRDSWVIVPPPEGGSLVHDVHSGADGNAFDGTPLGEL
ncbi:prepilin-type N-terminal cleavage/methylation domain-containing protein [Uliginosibacterium sp. 31-16]|uniref:type II secretion system protein n=1 Tax=Uliginosibacterium sp. 31-16 TaxID=3068315 RepID=UPI00273D4A18|nr:prepilin-type N-terminal cleavage/methylation domain-containing protein [Uliginosibacterium sp. 31-16]MDP5241112.1 prepilin-type N-terminal cleavage/methylation domain-containing protein [Uliginosibacterium sp. 31-16]